MSRKTCAYSGSSFDVPKSSSKYIRNWYRRTLDRIDSSKGYIKGNVVAVCNGINQFKSVIENKDTPLTMSDAEKIMTKIMSFYTKL